MENTIGPLLTKITEQIMSEIDAIKKELTKLKVRNQVLVSLLLILIIALISSAFVQPTGSKVPEVIRVQGIIIEDNKGNERILIGAPIPFAENRIRTDTSRIKLTWGKRMGGNYMKWYKNYNHDANGIVILDENGWDKIVIGDPVPDPIIGNRIGPETGMVYNDSQGLERSGYGLLDVEGELRTVLGLDHGNGTEGAALSVMPDGSVGLYLNSDGNSIFLGRATPSHWTSPDSSDFNGMIFQDNNDNYRIFKTKKAP